MAVTAIDDTSFETTDTIDTTPGDEAGYLALHLGGRSCHVWTFPTPTSTGLVAEASPGFQPFAGFVLPTFNAALDAVVDDDDAGLGFGAFTADAEAAAAWYAEDAADPTNTSSDLRAKALIVADAATQCLEASLRRFTRLGWELDYAAVDASPRYAVGIAIGAPRRPPVIAAVAM